MDKNDIKRGTKPSIVGGILGLVIGLGTNKSINTLTAYITIGIVGGYFVGNIGKWGQPYKK